MPEEQPLEEQTADTALAKRTGQKETMDIGKYILPISILVAGVLISASLLYTKGTGSLYQNIKTLPPTDNQQIPSDLSVVQVSADDDPVLGKADAPVTIIEFSDFQCPFCRAFWQDALPQIKKDYIDTGKARLVYRDFPLSFHPMAQTFAIAGNCANEQGKFWEMHDRIFSEQAKKGQGTITSSLGDVKKWANQIGLDASKFNQCLGSKKYNQEIEKDISDGNTAGVSGTPTAFVNGRKIVGAQPYATFKTLIDAALKK